jgi:hypothetical protein
MLNRTNDKSSPLSSKVKFAKTPNFNKTSSKNMMMPQITVKKGVGNQMFRNTQNAFNLMSPQATSGAAKPNLLADLQRKIGGAKNSTIPADSNNFPDILNGHKRNHSVD